MVGKRIPLKVLIGVIAKGIPNAPLGLIGQLAKWSALIYPRAMKDLCLGGGGGGGGGGKMPHD